MKNSEIIANLNNLDRFIAREVESNKAFTNTSAKFKLKKNYKALKNIYAIYNECIQEILHKYELTPQQDGSIKIDKSNPNFDAIQNELQELLNLNNEIVIERISDKDFTDDCLIGDELLIDFMTEESEV